MRKRDLNPEVFLQQEWAGLSEWLFRLYLGLCCMADREGRLEERPSLIKASILPFDDRDIEAGLSELAAVVDVENSPIFIQRYSDVSGGRYVYIVGWHEVQRPHHTESASKLPPAPGQPERRPRRRNAETERLKETFQRFWAVYPRKVAKAAAFRKWRALDPSDDLIETILAAVTAHVKTEWAGRQDKRMIPHPLTWLNGERWNDEPESAPPEPEGDVLTQRAKWLEG